MLLGFFNILFLVDFLNFLILIKNFFYYFILPHKSDSRLKSDSIHNEDYTVQYNQLVNLQNSYLLDLISNLLHILVFGKGMFTLL